MTESVSDLYFRLGLDYRDLQSGFVDAEKTISTNLRQLNRQKNIVQLRAQVELNGLDDAVNSTEILRIRQQALSEQMNIQRDRIQLVNAAYHEMVEMQGENAEISQQLALQLEQERFAMSSLERQTRSLAEQQKIALGFNFELLGLIEPAMKGIDSAIAAGYNIPIPHAKAVAAAAIGLTALITGTMDATEELRKENPALILSDGFSVARGNISNDLSYINDDVAKTAAAVDRAVQTTNANIQRNTQAAANSYTDYIKDLMRLEFILVADADNLSSALQNINSQMLFLRTKMGEYTALALGIGKTMQALANSAISFARPAIDSYRELNKAANELNISVSKTSDLLNIATLTGTDFGDIRDWVRGVQDAVLKGDSEDPEVIALEKYNVVIQDTYGNLLDFNTTHDRMIEGAMKAAEAGDLEAYAIMTQGEGIKDILPYLKSYAQAKRDINKIRWSTTDEAALKEASRNIRFMEIQIGEFKTALSALGVPLANMALENTFEAFNAATGLIEDNREAILYWEFVVIEAFKRAKDFVTDATESIIGRIKSLNKASEVSAPVDILAFPIIPGSKLVLDKIKELDEALGVTGKIADKSHSIADKVKSAISETISAITGNDTFESIANGVQKALNRIREFNDAFNIHIEKTRALTGEIRDRSLLDEIRDYDFSIIPDINIFDAAQKSLDEYLAANAKAKAESEETAESIAAGLSYSANRIKKYKAELADINRELKFGDNDYQKSLADLNAWRQEAMEDAKHYAHEREVIEELHDAKRLRIETDRANRLQEIRDSMSDIGESDLQRNLIAIAKERESWIKAGMSISEAVELSQKKINQLFKDRADKLQELRASLSGSWLTDLQKNLFSVDRDKRSWLEAGMSEVEATEIAERQKANIIAEFNRDVAANIDSIWNSELTNRLSQIDSEKQAWIRKGLDEQKATAWAEAMKAREITQFNAEVIANLDSIWKTALDNRLAQIEREKQAWIRKGVDEVKATKWAEQAKVDAQRDAAMSVLKSQLDAYKAFQQGGYAQLMKHQLDELAKAGISADDLKITPKQLAAYQEARDIVQRNLLPNFRTPYDIAEDKRLRGNQFVDDQRRTATALDKWNSHQAGERMFEPLTSDEVELLLRMPVMSKDALIPPEELDKMYKPLNSMADEFTTLTPQIGNVTANLGKLDNALTQFSAVEQPRLPDSPPTLAQFETSEISIDFGEIQLALDELVSPMEEVNAQFVEMTDKLIDVTSNLSDFMDELSQLQLPQNQPNNQQAHPTSPNITVTVQIEEAHAWDSRHIQELTDKVADKITPELIRAIGGDSNGY